MFKVYTVGGYNEVGKNMTVIEYKDDAFVFDLGLYLPAVVDLQETTKQPTSQMLRNIGAFPDDSIVEHIRGKVRAVMISHAHLDHVGAVQYVASRYPNADILGTPFTIEVLKTLMADTKTTFKNKLVTIHPNNSYVIKGRSGNYKVDMVNMTHSTLQCAIVALHLPEGIVAYANDYKLDNTPTLGLPPNYNKLRELSKEGVKLLIVDSLYSQSDGKTRSEKIAKVMLEEVMLTIQHSNNAIVITTFSSHIARLKSIVEFSQKLDRKIVFAGRSLAKYVNASKKVGLCPFQKDIDLISYPNQLKSRLKQIDKNRKGYVLVCTGHQGEPGSILDRIVSNKLPFTFKPQDSLIFSSKVIPTPVNLSNRTNMEKKVKKGEVRIFDNVHVSGHGYREDLRDLINLLSPEQVIPSHGSLEQLTPAIELAREMGYKFGKTCHLCQNGSTLQI